MSQALLDQPVAELPESGPRADSLVDSVVILLSLTILQRIVGFARGVLFCRWLDPEQLGQWDLAFDFLFLAAPLAVLGLPGSFGRYVEYYRQRGQLRTFLGRTMLVSAVLTALATAIVYAQPARISTLIFGRDDLIQLVWLWGACLGTVIAYNFITELFTALRLNRVAAVLQFINSMTFAALGIGLLLVWQRDASTLVISFMVACLIACAASLVWLKPAWNAIPPTAVPISHRVLWSKVAPFAVWVWTTNWLNHMFGMADRYMLVHYSGLQADDALAQVGQYHASRVLPLLFVTIANLIAAVITPYLSHDWETGNRDEVLRRLRGVIKFVACGLFTGGTAIALGSGFLFNVAFEGKYADGLAVLPWTLAYCTWFGLATVLHMYLWCAERARLGSLSLFIGLAVNVCLNLVLLPRYGLWGAVLATVAGNLVSLGLIAAFSIWNDFRFDRGTALLLALPIVFACGTAATFAAWCLVVAAMLLTHQIVTRDEKEHARAIVRKYASKLPGFQSTGDPY